MLHLGRLSRAKAERRFREMLESGFTHRSNLGDEALSLRGELVAAMPVGREMSEYQKDLTAGLGLYRVLSARGFRLRQAADDAVWRWLSLDLIPDIVHLRAGPDENLFFRKRWRLWLKRIWWYIHLSWQGDEGATRSVLASRTTDTIAQLVERPGDGFRVELWRKIVGRFADCPVSQDEFRRIMKLNTALLVGMEPSLAEGGLDGYVDRLYRAIGYDSSGNKGTSRVAG